TAQPHGPSWQVEPPAPGLAARPASNLLRRLPRRARKGLKSPAGRPPEEPPLGGAASRQIKAVANFRALKISGKMNCVAALAALALLAALAPAASTTDGKAAAAPEAEQAEKRYMRFGRSGDSAADEDGLDGLDSVDEHWPVEADKRYMRFGKRYMRFGKRYIASAEATKTRTLRWTSVPQFAVQSIEMTNKLVLRVPNLR
uniref:FGE-sulfatase domain-containing protein n=1 Tax=Macrostomum lignano TaxID=282301 RepID=A0A1I8F539_9PLAT